MKQLEYVASKHNLFFLVNREYKTTQNLQVF